MITLLTVVLVLFTLLLLATVVGHLFAPVTFVPTPKEVIDTVSQLVDMKRGETVIDLGAGDGRVLIEITERYSGIRAIGYEVVPLVWLMGKFRIWRSGKKIDLHMKDLRRANISQADVVVLYLIPSLMKYLQQKFAAELKSGARVVSVQFRFPDREPVEERRVMVGEKEWKIYAYKY